MKTRISLGFASVLLLFFVVYAIFANLRSMPAFLKRVALLSQVSEELNGFDFADQQLGTLGGAHLLESFTFEEGPRVYRLKVSTRLDRSVLGVELNLPLAEARLTDDQSRPPQAAFLELTLFDTQTFGLVGEERVELFRGPKTLVIKRGPLKEARLSVIAENKLQLQLGLDERQKFRLVAGQLPGELWLEILKQG